MKKINDAMRVLEFYVYANELKNDMVYDPDDYSACDHIFGSMILACAIDSEFKETCDLAKIYRMLFFTEFNNLHIEYDIDSLKLGKQYKSEILEAKDMFTNNGKLVFKYKLLDILLTRLIKDKENIISSAELIKQGSIVVSSLCNKLPSECREIFKFYYLNFGLKNKVRSGWDSKHWNIKSDRIERISEHVVATVSLALALNSEFNYNFDIDKVLKMLVIHETGETLIGDITPFDGITPEKKKEIEHKAMISALGNLKEKDKLLELLFEFDEKKTLEAKFSHYCDKIEADLQSKVYQDRGLHHSLDDQENNCVFKSPRVQQMLENGSENAFDIWYEWDKSIYENDKNFPEFLSILKLAKVNNLVPENEQISTSDDLVKKIK